MMAKMVDIGRKPDVRRRAVATGLIHLKPATIRAIRARHVEKGDPLPTAEVAGRQAVKAVWQVLPHTHPIPITAASVTFNVRSDRIVVTTSVEATYKTGVEMEALYGVVVALLTVWDMVKSLEKDRRLKYPPGRNEGIHLVAQIQGRPSQPSGPVIHSPSPA